MTDEREFFESLVYHSNQGRRFTQQSPVMPDVWITYAMKPGQQADLLLEPNWHYTPSDLAAHLSERLKLDKARVDLKKYRQEKPARPQIACNQNVVAVRLWFDQVVRAALPLSTWWRRSVAMLDDGERDALKRILAAKSLEKTLTLALKENSSKTVPADIIWFARVAGLIGYLGTAKAQATLKKAKSPHDKVERLKEIADNHALIARSFIGLLKGTAELAPGDDAPLFSVNLNRKSTQSVYASVNAIKGDAARALFSTKGKGIAWAVVDSGIDARHLAFRKYEREGGEEKRCKDPFPIESRRRVRVPTKERRFANNTRVVASYDFVNIRELLGAEPEEVDSAAFRRMFPILKDKAKRDELKALLAARVSHVIDWQRLDPFIRIPHNEQGYREPGNRHGTHVAGIIAADWRVEKGTDDGNPSQGIDLVGVAPDVELYDFRVLDDNGEGSEFGIMSALQLVRDLNNRRDFMAIHGANLSFSIQHDVANYACGRTPVCEEAERLVSNGIVVVAAAGNSGRARYVTPSGLEDEGFRTVSITDPGNAASVITVGSTHRSDAHTYGISYFSSRGPTGDGRLKPDLVAPGEKIRSTVPQNGDALLDGTSMAAPHASGAVALLLSRHPEFIGQPQRVKEILCKTATDLGRERYFQGAGLIDILRALQSV